MKDKTSRRKEAEKTHPDHLDSTAAGGKGSGRRRQYDETTCVNTGLDKSRLRRNQHEVTTKQAKCRRDQR